MRKHLALLAAVLLAAALRFPSLAARPLHGDEAVHADKFATLLEGGGYAYDPLEYHGPTLYYLTLPAAWLRGEARYVEVDEVTLRVVPAVCGVALVAAHGLARGGLGAVALVLAALLAAVSPAMVFYSRYFIHEVPLVLFSFGALLAGFRLWREGGLRPALALGVCAGLMQATKETAPLALVSMAVALTAAVALERRRADKGARPEPAPRLFGLLCAVGVAVGVAALLFSSFFRNPVGVVDAVRAYAPYLDRATHATWHFHPWDYYLRLLVHFPAAGTPFWTEGLILALALVGAGAAFRGRAIPGVDPLFLRFVALYTLLLLALYSAIPYKTPWCLLGFLHGMILLAGAGVAFLLKASPGRLARAGLATALLGATAHLAHQAYAGSFRFASDPRNPYVYAHTTTDVFAIVDRLKGLARAHPDGLALPVQIVSRENLWPLPFYLREFTNVAWWNGVSDTAKAAPVILLTPDMESALVRRLYDLPPPGERELYVNAFERPVELRPAVELRGYAVGSLWERFRQLSADTEAAGDGNP